jgi:tRNA dimethylallyltransferase
MIPIVTIEGTTASGKSRLAMELARRLNTEIISADSRQIYRFMDIGTAKPNAEEQATIPHHLIDIVYPNERYNAGDFAEDAEEIAEKLIAEEKLPLVVGGTGFYIKSLLQGLFKSPDVPESIRQKLQDDLVNKGLDSLYTYLESVDPEAALNIYAQDRQRILRALEVFEHTGKPISHHWKEQQLEPKFKAFRILLSDDRELIYQRINTRFDRMIEEGLLIEIEELLQRGYTPEDYGLTAVGYKEFMPYFYENKSLEECIEQAKQNSRKYAKRQITWYRKYSFNRIINPIQLTDSYLDDLTHDLKELL